MKTDKIERLQQHYSEFLLKGGEKPSEEYKEEKDFSFEKDKAEIPRFDFVLHGGDFDNLTHEQSHSSDDQAKSMGNITGCLNFLE